MEHHILKSRVVFGLGLHCGINKKLVILPAGGQIPVSLEYIHGKEFIHLLDKRWVELVFSWEDKLNSVKEIPERQDVASEKKTRKRKKADAIQEQSATKMDVLTTSQDG